MSMEYKARETWPQDREALLPEEAGQGAGPLKPMLRTRLSRREASSDPLPWTELPAEQAIREK